MTTGKMGKIQENLVETGGYAFNGDRITVILAEIVESCFQRSRLITVQ